MYKCISWGVWLVDVYLLQKELQMGLLSYSNVVSKKESRECFTLRIRHKPNFLFFVSHGLTDGALISAKLL